MLFIPPVEFRALKMKLFWSLKVEQHLTSNHPSVHITHQLPWLQPLETNHRYLTVFFNIKHVFRTWMESITFQCQWSRCIKIVTSILCLQRISNQTWTAILVSTVKWCDIMVSFYKLLVKSFYPWRAEALNIMHWLPFIGGGANPTGSWYTLFMDKWSACLYVKHQLSIFSP